MYATTWTGVFRYTKAGLAVAIVLSSLLAIGQEEAASGEARPAATRDQMPAWGVCPPFHLRDEEGNIINPMSGENVDKPYSPKQTCGQCHDYDKITQGYHFMQGKDEETLLKGILCYLRLLHLIHCQVHYPHVYLQPRWIMTNHYLQ